MLICRKFTRPGRPRKCITLPSLSRLEPRTPRRTWVQANSMNLGVERRSSLALIHRSAWKGNSANFAVTAFYELLLVPVLGGSEWQATRRARLRALESGTTVFRGRNAAPSLFSHHCSEFDFSHLSQTGWVANRPSDQREAISG